MVDLSKLAEEAWWEDNQWHYLTSSNVDAFKYDPETKSLWLNFHGNRIYKYFEIPRDLVSDLASTDSPGGWFHANLAGAPFERE